MVNNINNSTYNNNRYEKINYTNKVSEKLDNLHQEDSAENTLFEKYNKIETKENMKFLVKMQKDIQKAELITIKIVRGENLTKEELEFISEKYPELKETGEKAIKENNNLKEVFKNYKTEKQIQEVISKIIKNINNMENDGLLSKSQSKIKLYSVVELQKYAKSLNEELKKAETIAVKIVKGEKLTKEEAIFITEKYPQIKKFAQESIKENIKLQENLKYCKTDLKKQEVLSKVINDVKDKGEKGFFSKSEVKIKLEGILEIKKTLQNEVSQLKKAIIVGVKFIRLGKLTTSENKFITEKYPDIKRFVQKILIEYENLKEEIKYCQSDEKRHKVLHNKIAYIKDIDKVDSDKTDILKEIQDRLKKEAIYKIKEYEQNNYKENDMKFYMYPYWYLVSNGVWPKMGLITIVLIVVIILIYSLV